MSLFFACFFGGGYYIRLWVSWFLLSSLGLYRSCIPSVYFIIIIVWQNVQVANKQNDGQLSVLTMDLIPSALSGILLIL